MGSESKFGRYKRHFICVECRKGFKQPNEKDMADANGELSIFLDAFYFSKPRKRVPKDIVAQLRKKYFQNEIKCPECAAPMTEVSKGFLIPPKRKAKEWEALRLSTFMHGKAHHSVQKRRKEERERLKDCWAWPVERQRDQED